MAKATLPVNFKDDILNSSMNGKRRYNLIQNSDGTVSLEDVSTYDQVGSNFGAGNINATNTAVNNSFDKSKIVSSISDINALTQSGYVPDALALKSVNNSLAKVRTYVGSDGKLHFVNANGADTVLPFSGVDNVASALTPDEAVKRQNGVRNVKDMSQYSKIIFIHTCNWSTYNGNSDMKILDITDFRGGTQAQTTITINNLASTVTYVYVSDTSINITYSGNRSTYATPIILLA